MARSARNEARDRTEPGHDQPNAWDDPEIRRASQKASGPVAELSAAGSR